MGKTRTMQKLKVLTNLDLNYPQTLYLREESSIH